MTSHRACEACGADLPVEGAACVACRRVACWDCGSANSADQAFCRRCGVWLVSEESARTMASYTRLASTAAPAAPAQSATSPVDGPWDTRPIATVPIRLRPAPSARGRWAALTLAVLIAAGALGSAVALDLRRPQGTMTAVAAAGSASTEGSDDAITAATTVAPTQSPVTDIPAAAADGASLPDASPAATPSDAVEEAAPVDAADAIANGSAARPDAPAPPRNRSGWVCDDSVRLTDTQSRRWTVDRLSFLAMDGFERVILHLDEDGPSNTTPSALGAPMAASGVRGAGGSTSRAAVRRGIGVELSGGIRSGLELRSFRPKGLRTIRDLSLYRAGSTSRLLIGLASGGCFRMKALPWQAGPAGASADRQLIIDVKG